MLESKAALMAKFKLLYVFRDIKGPSRTSSKYIRRTVIALDKGANYPLNCRKAPESTLPHMTPVT